MEKQDEFESFMAQPRADLFVGMVKSGMDRGLSYEDAVKAAPAALQTILDRVTDGLFNSQSRWHEAAIAFKRGMADQIWDALNAQQAAA